MSNVTAGTESGHLYAFQYPHTVPKWANCIVRNVPETPCLQKTVPVIGVPIGGTSVVSAVLDALGVMMGDQNRLRAGNAFEDGNFMDMTKPGIVDVIKQRNEQHDVWGFKNPFGVSVLKKLHLFRNPYCVFVFRDPIASAHNYSRSHKLTVDQGIEQFHKQTEAHFQAMMQTTLPSLLVSYERIKSTPEFFIQALSNFVGLTPTIEQWVDALGRISSRGGYLAMPREYGPGPGNQPPKE